MKIIHVVTQMEAGGAQGAAIRNAQAMRRQGVDASVCFLYRKRGVYDNCSGVVSLLSRSPSGVLDYIKIFLRLFSYLRREKPNAIIAYTHYANVIAGAIGRMALVPRIVVSHRNPVYSYPSLCRRVDKILGVLGFYHIGICVSNTVLHSFDQYPARYKKRLVMIRNGVDVKAYAEPDPMPFEIEQSNRHKGKFKFITSGRLHPQKNQKVIFDAIAGVDDAILVVAGDGELRHEYECYIKLKGLEDRVKLIGEIPPSRINAFLHWGDAFLFPSRYEAFGFSVVEAMAAGKPVLCSDIPAMREVVGDAGVLLPPDQPAEWTAAMKILSMDTERSAALSDISRKRSQDFSIDKMVQGYIDAAS